MPTIAGLGGYVVGTLLLVVPLLFLRRGARLPHGTVTVLVAAIAVPAAALSQLIFVLPAIGAVAGASLVDLKWPSGPQLPVAVLAGLVQGLVWAGHLGGRPVAACCAGRWSCGHVLLY